MKPKLVPKKSAKIKAITLKNFKSFKHEARLPFAPLTVLIGANASGKSNAIEGLRFLSWLAQGGQFPQLEYDMSQGAVSLRGNAANLPYRETIPMRNKTEWKERNTFHFECETDMKEWNNLALSVLRRKSGELHVLKEEITGPTTKIPLYTIKKSSAARTTDVMVAYNNFDKGGIKPHIPCTGQRAIFTQLTSPAFFGGRNEIPNTVQTYSTLLANILFLDVVPAKMRGYAFPEKKLRADGENLSGVLHNLWEPHTPMRGEILSFIKSLPEQNISEIDFWKEDRGGKMVKLCERFGATSSYYDASLLSDGTLRVLAITAALLSATRGSLVVIEEIDNGVHPSRVKHLVSKIREVAERRGLSVLVSTHNPAFLDALPYEAIPDVVYCYRDPNDGSSRLLRLNDIGDDYPQLVAQGDLGYLSTSGILENFVKHRPSPEERKTRFLAWQEKMRKGVNVG